MQASRGAHPYRQQGHSIATASSAPGGLEGGEHTITRSKYNTLISFSKHDHALPAC